MFVSLLAYHYNTAAHRHTLWHILPHSAAVLRTMPHTASHSRTYHAAWQYRPAAHCCVPVTYALPRALLLHTVAYMHCRTWPRTLPDTTAGTAAHCCTTAQTLPRTALPFSCCAALIQVLMLVYGYVQSKAPPLLLRRFVCVGGQCAAVQLAYCRTTANCC